MNYDNIDIIYYINLDSRLDRNDQFLNELKKIDFPSEKVKRISAIYNEKGAIGCTSSHIKTLEEFINSSFENCIIFEDDFDFLVDGDGFKNILNNLFNSAIDFDVVCLSTHVKLGECTTYDFLKKIICSNLSSGYLIKKKYAIKHLLNNYISSKKLLELEYNQELYSLDQYWTSLQKIHNWYVFYPKVGRQRESFSDIDKIIKNINHLENNDLLNLKNYHKMNVTKYYFNKKIN